MQVNVLEAKNRLSALLKEVAAGKDIVISNRGKPIAKLTRISDEAGAAKGTAIGILDWLDQNPTPPHARRSPEAIDSQIGSERDAWE